MITWRDFWNSDTPIYVNARHKALHYKLIARDIGRLVPSGAAVVLDHGCGEALSAGEVARRCARLYLCDAAAAVRERIACREAGDGRVTVLSPEDVTALPDGTLDLVVANSLAQYLTREELATLLNLWRQKLKPTGRLVIADIIPPGVSAIDDVRALLSFAVEGGFLLAALGGLVRTFFSDYRKLRGTLGLTHYDEAEMLALLEAAGFMAARHYPNLGHNQTRMCFGGEPRP